MKKILKQSVLFAILGFIAGVAVVPFQSDALQGTLANAGAEEISIPLLMLISGVQIAIMSFVFSLIGLLLSKKVDLQLSSAISKPALALAIFGGMGGAGLMILLDLYVFLPLIPQISNFDVTWWKGLLGGLLYGGIFEEVAMRLFLMTLIVWLLAKIVRRSQAPAWIYWTGIFGASLLFAIGHLPATQFLFGEITSTIIVRTLLMNGGLGILFGYIYWKRGLAYAILAHMSSHIFIYGIVKGIFQ